MDNGATTTPPIDVITRPSPTENNTPPQTNMADQTGSGTPEQGSVGLIDGKQNYKRNQQKEQGQGTACSGRVWMILTVVFIITTIAAVGVLLWRELSVHSKTEIDVTTRFPNFFRTPVQQQQYAKRVSQIEREEIVYTNSTVLTNMTCTFNCYDNRQQRKKRAALSGVTYHACCMSETKFISPDHLDNILGQKKTVVQFKDKKQFFQIEECSQSENCNGCNCAQTIKFVSAVVENEAATNDEDKYMLDIVKIPGCCKCINVGRGRRKRSVLENVKFWTKMNVFIKKLT